jgi:hypothetical protein
MEEAQVEAQIANSNSPSGILNPLRTLAYTQLDPSHTIRVRKVVKLFVAADPQFDLPQNFNTNFQAFLNIPPPPFAANLGDVFQCQYFSFIVKIYAKKISFD